MANVSKEKYTGGIRQISGSGMVNSVQMSAVERLLVYGDQGSGARVFYLIIGTDAFENTVCKEKKSIKWKSLNKMYEL